MIINELIKKYANNLAIDYNHNVHVWGDNGWGIFWIDSSIKHVYEPIISKYFNDNNIKINKCYTGYSHTLTIGYDNKLCFLFGKNNFGQIGNDTLGREIYEPFELKLDDDGMLVEKFRNKKTTYFIKIKRNINCKKYVCWKNVSINHEKERIWIRMNI